MRSTTVTVTTATAVGTLHPLDAQSLARACGAEIDWVVQLVEVGIVEAPAPRETPADWRFDSDALELALEARRLERDFDVNLDAAALIIDLQRELRRLRGVLQAQGLGLGLGRQI